MESGEMAQLLANMPWGQMSQEAEFQPKVMKRLLMTRMEKTWPPAWSDPKLPVSGFVSAEAGSVGKRAGGLLVLGGSWARSLYIPLVSEFLC